MLHSSNTQSCVTSSQKVPEWQCCTVMIGLRQRLSNHLQSSKLARTYIISASILPTLKAATGGFFRNFLEFCRSIWFDVLHGCEKLPHEAHFQNREHPKATLSEIWSVQSLGDERNVSLGKGIVAQNAMCVSGAWRHAESTVPDIFRAASSTASRNLWKTFK
jgi:hypothetical protein